MSNNEKQDEKELWQRIPNTQGTERAETFVALSHIAYDRGDHKACLALCESAREIYEELGAETSTTGQLYVALSRCTTLGGLVLRQPIDSSQVILDERVMDFHLDDL